MRNLDFDKRKENHMRQVFETLKLYTRISRDYLNENDFDKFIKLEKELFCSLQRFYRSYSALVDEEMREVIKNDINNCLDNLLKKE